MLPNLAARAIAAGAAHGPWYSSPGREPLLRGGIRHGPGQARTRTCTATSWIGLDRSASVTAAGEAPPTRRHKARATRARPSPPPARKFASVLNRVSNTLAVIDTAGTPPVLLTETAVGTLGSHPAGHPPRAWLPVRCEASAMAPRRACGVPCQSLPTVDLTSPGTLGDPGGATAPSRPPRWHLPHPMKGPMMTPNAPRPGEVGASPPARGSARAFLRSTTPS